MRGRTRRVPRLRLAIAALVVCGCMRSKKGFENWNPTISPSHFKTIATIASSGSRSDIRIMVQLRQDLQKAGVNAVPAAGRWETVSEAMTQVCGPAGPQPLDGLVVVGYDHLVLYDCQSLKPAFEIQGAQNTGITAMTERLIKYLKGKAPASAG